MKQTTVFCPNCGTEFSISEHEHIVKNATVIGEDSGLGAIPLPVKKEGKAEERLSLLAKAGVDTSNLFAMRSASGEGMLVRLNNGVPEMVNDDDPIFASIVNGGTIPERRLFRRWVMSQMFGLLTYKSYRNDSVLPINDAIRRKGYEYQWKMLIEEMRVQSILNKKDMENFYARNWWFNKEVCVSLAKHYIGELTRYISSLPERKCKGIPYKRVGGKNIFTSDIQAKIIAPLCALVKELSAQTTPNGVYVSLVRFNSARIKMSWETSFCKEWIDAYKGSGAYFTMKNLIMFHGCRIHGDKSNEVFTKETSLELLEERANQYEGEGWRMFAMMKKLIKDNGIDIEAKRKEWREAKRNR